MDINNEGLDNSVDQPDATVEQPEYTPPKVTIADTSTKEFFESDGGEFDDEEQPQSNTQATQEKPQVETKDTPTDEGTEGQVELSYKGNNQYLSAFEQWARQNGIDEKQIDFTSFDDENFGEEHMNHLVGKIQAMRYIEQTDPTLHKIIESGVSLDDYIQQKAQYDHYINLPDEQLFKGQLYDHLVKQHHEMGTLMLDENGGITDQSQKMLIEEVDRYYSNLSPEQVKAKTEAIRNHLQQSMQQIPQHLQQRYQQQQQQALERFNEQRKAYIDEVNKTIDKSKTLVTDFSGQAEKEEFKKFFNEMTSLQEVDADGHKQQVVPLFHALQNDSKMMLKVLRLLHLDKNGYFTDHKMSARKDAYNLLGLSPQVTAKNSKGSKNAGTFKGVNIADTSQKEFWE